MGTAARTRNAAGPRAFWSLLLPVLVVLLTWLQCGHCGGRRSLGDSSSGSNSSGSKIDGVSGFDYTDALRKCLLFFEAQRSGKLPPDQRVKWRGNSGLNDGRDVGADLSGGYYDSGDTIKFGLPLAFTVTTLAWGTVDFATQLRAAGQLQYALQAVKWGADYLVNAHPQPNVLHAQVGDPEADHDCWWRPEDTAGTRRPTYTLTPQKPGSEVAAESAAALAASALAWQSTDPAYAARLLVHAQQLFAFADKYRAKYTRSIPNVAEHYDSYDFKDELLWAAAWLARAYPTNPQYMAYVVNNGARFGGTTDVASDFSWDDKVAGAQILLSKALFGGQQAGWATSSLNLYWRRAQDYACQTIKATRRTPGGLLFLDEWSSLQYATSASLTMSALAKYTEEASRFVTCGDGTRLQPSDLRAFVKSQVDYILGSNPLRMSYMVGFGTNYPRKAHHCGSSIPSIQQLAPGLKCGDGWRYFSSPNANPNVLEGAVVGGPNISDGFSDRRDNYHQNEVSTYVNSPLVGALATLAGGLSRP